MLQYYYLAREVPCKGYVFTMCVILFTGNRRYILVSLKITPGIFSLRRHPPPLSRQVEGYTMQSILHIYNMPAREDSSVVPVGNGIWGTALVASWLSTRSAGVTPEVELREYTMRLPPKAPHSCFETQNKCHYNSKIWVFNGPKIEHMYDILIAFCL